MLLCSFFISDLVLVWLYELAELLDGFLGFSRLLCTAVKLFEVREVFDIHYFEAELGEHAKMLILISH
ncbi:hypothetical protein UUC_09953 [Rhodanobacter denitrificans]|nr:hypothetical protein UUC_09953 [Rhodanobacter denitrificans]